MGIFFLSTNFILISGCMETDVLTCRGGEDSAQEVVTKRRRGSGCKANPVQGSDLSRSEKYHLGYNIHVPSFLYGQLYAHFA